MNKVIVYENDLGSVDILIPILDCGLTIEQIAQKDVPIGKNYSILNRSSIPANQEFRKAWIFDGQKVIEDFAKSKIVSHDIRREFREFEFKPLDELIMKQIPSNDFNTLEMQRQVIRDKYAVFQIEIDNCNSIDVLHLVVQNMASGLNW